MQPSQSIPSTANVTVAERGEVRHPPAKQATVVKKRRLVISVRPHVPAITAQNRDL
jgi:hypothetical protein